ncbi:MaoC family dehydratase [Rhizobium leguminosarum]|uniref:MaoC family dehydratase n=1 Tax=Rhizobium leguminosarum TaxID=384 RepID=UPI001C95C2CE|nr:MaoC family dehydratase [Rhizobium leguminosarum]MBY5775289.1 MaoC family dehydratase [Rhizobium leguminosarum]
MSSSSGLTRVERSFEDFIVGAVYRHWPGRTIYEGDHRFYCLITLNHYYQESVVHPGYLYSLLLGMSLNDLAGRLLFHEENQIVPINPVRYGDTIRAETEVLSKEEIADKPNRGIVLVRTRGFSQEGTLFMQYERRLGILKASAGGRQEAVPRST